ncbi:MULTISPECIES: TetR/AcrR family transcriptional regulator [unclassified Nocardia]|uniref:TetR/AcrR family transcriptional regulator n=1 Tax=unclassified Nocardia TaxID=2637762 RepID=UPI001CE437E8|nr:MULTISPECIES: TetR/AcrR family transcriptional regulator [unclassified Nocardia]
MDVIWMRPERAARGPKPAHSRDELAASCVRVADTEGLDAVSMRRVAAELGTGTTSLYRYVTSKDDLFDLMVDQVLGSVPLPRPTQHWRRDLTLLASWKRALILDHPWMASLSGRPAVGPHGLALQERGLRAVDGWGLSIDEMIVIVESMDAYVQGYAVRELAERAATLRSGQDLDTWMAAHDAYARTIIDSGRFPLVTKAWLDANEPHAADRAERGFRHGLDRLLDGYAAGMRQARERPRR